LAEALLLAAQRWLERADDDDLDVLNFSDACRALQVASRLGQRDATPKAGDASPPENNLRDELNTLLDRVFPDPQPDATPTP
jgi:hypothetical protein